LGPGNNIALCMRIRSCTNVSALRLRGPQHPTLEATLPFRPSPHRSRRRTPKPCQPRWIP